MRVCVVYDCLFPHTVGGAERWYRHLSLRLVERGHHVSYLTRRQWPAADAPDLPGASVVAVSRAEELYDEEGQRRIGQALRFGWGVFWHLLRHRRAYDVVHVSSFPYFSLLGARVALMGSGTRVVVDWHEVWSASYWREYLGGVKGRVGELVQRLCVRASPTAFVFSEMNGRRLREVGLGSEPIKLAGLYTGDARHRPSEAPREPVVLYAGRHIAEKRVPSIVPALARARESAPELRGLILGDGPEQPRVREAVRAFGQQEAVEVAGFVDGDRLQRAMARAEMLILPSRREGYGMIVIEAAGAGLPVVVVPAEDNAATELVAEGVNGVVARSDAVEDVADAILRVHAESARFQRATAEWFAAQAGARSADASVEQVIAAYGE